MVSLTAENHISVACIFKEIGTLRKNIRALIWGSHRPQHRVGNIKLLVTNDETGFKVLALKDLLEGSKANRQPTGKRET
jgi:hypothetical protein